MRKTKRFVRFIVVRLFEDREDDSIARGQGAKWQSGRVARCGCAMRLKSLADSEKCPQALDALPSR